MAAAEVPDFDTEYMLQCNGVNIDVGWFAAPCVVDWDLDGLNDLVLGQFTTGKIRFYKNVGTNDAPVFNAFSFIQADGVDISVPSG